MSARTQWGPARFASGDQRRRSMLGKVHIAKKTLGLSDDDYVAVLLRVAGRGSAGDCSEAELAAVIKEFESKGFTAKARPIGGSSAAPRPADHPSAKKARALWISLHQLGAIDDPSERALEAFARRQLKCERLQWADQALTYRLIEALKAMAQRHGWDQGLEGVAASASLLTLKRRLVDAIHAKLVAAGLVPAEWTAARAAFEFGGAELSPAIVLWTLDELDGVAKVFGATLRGVRS